MRTDLWCFCMVTHVADWGLFGFKWGYLINLANLQKLLKSHHNKRQQHNRPIHFISLLSAFWTNTQVRQLRLALRSEKQNGCYDNSMVSMTAGGSSNVDCALRTNSYHSFLLQTCLYVVCSLENSRWKNRE